MPDLINRSQISGERWLDTRFLRLDEKEEYRERPQYGNQHAIFENDSEWGYVHTDKHNATDFPNGTLDHASLYVNEQTGISETIAKIGIIAISLYGIYKLFKFLDDK